MSISKPVKSVQISIHGLTNIIDANGNWIAEIQGKSLADNIVSYVNNYDALYDLVKQMTTGPFTPAMWVGQAQEVLKQIESCPEK